MSTGHIDVARHPIEHEPYAEECGRQLLAAGALVLPGFFTPGAISQVREESAKRSDDAFYANSTHNVYLTPTDEHLPNDHVFNHQIRSSKGLIADDQIPNDSPLRQVYNDEAFRTFLCRVLGIASIYPYGDELSSINVHFAPEGKELGWHFDNSSFAVTMLLQAPEGGGRFEYVPAVRDADAGEMGFKDVAAILGGDRFVETLKFDPGDLVVFRGRNALHRVTPTEGGTTRMLVVFAYNDRPGIGLSESALQTFYGRTA